MLTWIDNKFIREGWLINIILILSVNKNQFNQLMNQVQSVRIRAPPVADDTYFEDLDQAIRSSQVYSDSSSENVDDPIFDQAVNESEPALPKARKAGPLERDIKPYSDDANAELTLNLLKISTQEEVKLIKQSNSEFFQELKRS